jgi:Tfp pilus tip-associated adhesin PilY1
MVASDPASTAQRTIYGVVDDGTSTTYTPANLVNQTTTINSITSSSKGWYVRLGNGSGERVTRNAALINGTLYVPSYKPSTAVCNDGGQSWLYTLDFKDGSAPDNANGTANNVTTGRSQSMGDGMLSDPTVDLVNEVLLLQSSNAVVMSQSIPGGLKKLVVRGWHQKWN